MREKKSRLSPTSFDSGSSDIHISTHDRQTPSSIISPHSIIESHVPTSSSSNAFIHNKSHQETLARTIMAFVPMSSILPFTASSAIGDSKLSFSSAIDARIKAFSAAEADTYLMHDIGYQQDPPTNTSTETANQSHSSTRGVTTITIPGVTVYDAEKPENTYQSFTIPSEFQPDVVTQLQEKCKTTGAGFLLDNKDTALRTVNEAVCDALKSRPSLFSKKAGPVRTAVRNILQLGSHHTYRLDKDFAFTSDGNEVIVRFGKVPTPAVGSEVTQAGSSEGADSTFVKALAAGAYLLV